MTRQLLIAGGGIGGLAAALACSQVQAQPGNDPIATQVFERSAQFEAIGAGIQLGPNATRRLQAWGLGDALAASAAVPDSLVIRSAGTGRELARMALAGRMDTRYGAPYLCLHRADLQALLLTALQCRASVEIVPNAAVSGFEVVLGGVQASVDASCAASTAGGLRYAGQALIAADGIWSSLRQQTLADGLAEPTGHMAWRALPEQRALPAALRSNDVTVWLGCRFHAVSYPVRQRALLNIVVITQASVWNGSAAVAGEGPRQQWSHPAPAAALLATAAPLYAGLQDLLHAAADWRIWLLAERRPLSGPQAMQDARWAGGRVALLGDAAHPMRPYLAQGAAMAIEDAYALAAQLGPATAAQWPGALAAYALSRWQRNARVQARAVRNGQLFHAAGLLRAGRDAALQVMGARLLDQPWLYRY
jgi:salicylate hydroxylase